MSRNGIPIKVTDDPEAARMLQAAADELVVFESSRCFPRYVITLQRESPEQALKQKCEDQLYQQARHYLDEKAWAKVLPWLRAAAALGSPDASRVLGEWYQAGKMLPKHPHQARYWFSRGQRTSTIVSAARFFTGNPRPKRFPSVNKPRPKMGRSEKSEKSLSDSDFSDKSDFPSRAPMFQFWQAGLSQSGEHTRQSKHRSIGAASCIQPTNFSGTRCITQLT